MENIGTVVRGIKTPIITPDMDLSTVVVDSLLKAAEEGNFKFNDKDVVAITESIVGRCEGNYVTVDHIAEDIKRKFPEGDIGVIFPIFSRNRFALCLKGIARGCKKITLMLSYPTDEVGNHLFDEELMEKSDINPYKDILDENKYRECFGYKKHIFTGVDYVEYFKDLINKENCEIEVIFANYPEAILNYTKNVLVCDIHTRFRTKNHLKEKCERLFSIDEILTESINGSGFNEKYGLLGSNRATDNTLKLFPRTGDILVKKVQDLLKEKTGKIIEVMVYGDGAFKDPVGKIWELADPVVSPAYTNGLEGTPNELKLKYLADNKYANLKGEELKAAMKKEIEEKDNNLVGKMETQGTTPRRYTDLLGSLCDLTSGSGDKGTPVVLVQGYFDNYAS